MHALVITLLAATLALQTVSQRPVALDELLRRAGQYVRQFERDFAAVITDELYEQDYSYQSYASTVAHEHRTIRSEMLFMRLPGQGLSWLTARNVLTVDGEVIKDSAERLERAIKGDARGLVDRLRTVAEESARFNLGRVRRNFNDPMLALLFLDPEYQPRFTFSLGDEQDVGGVRARRIAFKERQSPSIVREMNGKDLFGAGSLWVRTDDGVVVRTELTGTSRAAATVFDIRVDYRPDSKLEMWMPVRMTERYERPPSSEEIRCVATYSNPRRFETSGRVIVK